MAQLCKAALGRISISLAQACTQGLQPLSKHTAMCGSQTATWHVSSQQQNKNIHSSVTFCCAKGVSTKQDETKTGEDIDVDAQGVTHMDKEQEECNKDKLEHTVANNSSQNDGTSPKDNFKYFQSLSKGLSQVDKHNEEHSLQAAISQIQSETHHIETISDLKTQESKSTTDLIADIYKGVKLSEVKPALQKESYNLATYVNESEVLTNLVKLGVDLTKVEKDREAANFLLKLEYMTEVEPFLRFLHVINIPDSDLGKVISRFPGIFQCDISDLEVRLNYFESKGFTSEAIVRIVTKLPEILGVATVDLDFRLGCLQKDFKLTGEEVRDIFTRCPKLAVWSRDKLKMTTREMKEFCGFTENEQKTMFVTQPKIYLTESRALKTRFNYIHNVMGLSHEQIVKWPNVFRTRVTIIRQRYMFLKHLERDQFDPNKENYVSLKALVAARDIEFCKNVAKVPVRVYNEFLKSM